MVAWYGDTSGNIRDNARTEHGNSGAGLYSDGKLVGIVTHLVACSMEDVIFHPMAAGCGGRATSLAGRHADWFAR